MDKYGVSYIFERNQALKDPEIGISIFRSLCYLGDLVEFTAQSFVNLASIVSFWTFNF